MALPFPRTARPDRAGRGALHNQSTRSDFREIRRCEVHIVVAGRKRFRAFQQSPDLRLTARIMTTKKFALLLGQALRLLTHDGTRLWRKVRCCADQDHGFNALRAPWLPCVEERCRLHSRRLHCTRRSREGPAAQRYRLPRPGAGRVSTKGSTGHGRAGQA